MSSDSLQINTTDTTSKRRSHSNTISGGRPPALDMDTIRPPSVRRNSEGSPHLPPPICVSEPTPIEPSTNHNGFFNDNKSTVSSANSSRPSTPNSDANQAPPPPLPKGSATAPVGGLLDSPAPKKKNRSRASSLTTNLIHEIKESSTIQNLASKIKSRHSSEEPETDRSSLDMVNSNTPAGSIAGVSLATSKKNEDFHALFRSVPEDDNLIEDFGCALQKEILLQGRIYISESYLCFNANIFGWVTNLVIAFEDIIDIEKKSTAIFIPNAIQISTDNAKHFFASFLSRDSAYDLMVDIWRNARPDLIPNKDGDSKRDSADASDSFDEEDEDSGSYYDSDTEDSYSDESDIELVETPEAESPGTASDSNRPRKVSMNSLPVTKDTKSNTDTRRRAASELPRPKAALTEDKPAASATAEQKNDSAESKTAERVQVNEKTECECASKGDHYPNVVMDQVYNGTLDKFYELFYESNFMKNFLVDNQKSTELTIGEWKKGDGGVVAVRDKSYIKPLNGAIGPKSTKCIITEEILHKDFDNSITALNTTCTPDVPSGGSFSCKTKTCMTWAGKGKVRIFVTVLVDFTKSSWLKSTIEKASLDGQTTYYKELDAAIRAHAKENPSDVGGSSTSKSEGRRRRKGKRSKHKREPKPEVNEVKEEKSDSAVHRVLGSISNAIADVITGAIDIICSPKASHLTLICLIAMVFLNIFIARKMAYVEQQLTNFGQTPANVVDETAAPPLTHQQQRREYNRQEEDDLWEWLGRVDPDKSSPLKEKVMYKSEDIKEQEAVWDNAIQTSKSAKERLDRHMAELSDMIKKAESNLEQVTQAVNEQRKKIQQD